MWHSREAWPKSQSPAVGRPKGLVSSGFFQLPSFCMPDACVAALCCWLLLAAAAGYWMLSTGHTLENYASGYARKRAVAVASGGVPKAMVCKLTRGCNRKHQDWRCSSWLCFHCKTPPLLPCCCCAAVVVYAAACVLFFGLQHRHFCRCMWLSVEDELKTKVSFF